jgi:hypothetical protein
MGDIRSGDRAALHGLSKADKWCKQITRVFSRVLCMLDRFLIWTIDTTLLLFGALVIVVLYAANEIGFRVGLWRTRNRPVEDRHLSGIGSITAGMLGLLAFTLGLTINVAQTRFELRRNLVLLDANAIESAWLRSKLISGEQGPRITGLIEEFAKVQLTYVSSDTFDVEPGLIAQKNALQAQIWQAMQIVAREQPSNAMSALGTSLVEMFNAARSQRFAFESRVPASLSWLLMGGSVLAISAMGYHLGATGNRHILLTSLLLVMWAGGMGLIADLNRPRIGAIRVDPAPLRWLVDGFDHKP